MAQFQLQAPRLLEVTPLCEQEETEGYKMPQHLQYKTSSLVGYLQNNHQAFAVQPEGCNLLLTVRRLKPCPSISHTQDRDVNKEWKRCCLQQSLPALLPTEQGTWGHQTGLPGPTVTKEGLFQAEPFYDSKAPVLCFVTLLTLQSINTGTRCRKMEAPLVFPPPFSCHAPTSLHTTYFSSLGCSRRCKRSLTTDFCSNTFSLLFPGQNKNNQAFSHQCKTTARAFPTSLPLPTQLCPAEGL